MLVYEEDRTENLVKRLVMIGRIARFQIIFNCLVTAGVLGAVVGYALSHEGSIALIGSIIGLVIGYCAGAFTAGLVTVGIEWMAQMLVVQENLLFESKTRSTIK